MQMLDKVLDWFALESDNLFENEENENVLESLVYFYIIKHSPELENAKYFLSNITPILNKLKKDGYLDTKEITPTSSDKSYPLYSVTLDGKFFSNKGGYTHQYELDNRTIRTAKILNATIAISGGVVAVYYVFEIIRHYIMPLLRCQNTCG